MYDFAVILMVYLLLFLIAPSFIVGACTLPWMTGTVSVKWIKAMLIGFLAASVTYLLGYLVASASTLI